MNRLNTNDKDSRLALLAVTARDEPSAARLAQRLQLPQVATGIAPGECVQVSFLLVVSGRAVYLQQTGVNAPGPVAVDFGSAALRYRRRSGTPELLGKAVGRHRSRRLVVLDATAGLGRDAFILAALGNEVRLCERDPVVVELLRAGLAAGGADEDLRELMVRMSLHPGDARQLDAAAMRDVDVVYLDPMFPGRVKSAAVKKEMAVFQQLLGQSPGPGEADDLLRWALAQGVARVVVKRPARAPALAGASPSHCVNGKSVRYDVYVARKIG